MRSFFVLVVAVPLTCFSGSSLLAEQDAQTNAITGQDAFKALFSKFGASYTVQKNPCRVEMNIQQSEFLDHIKDAQKLDLINEDVTQERINQAPFTMTTAMIFQLMPPIVKNVYEDNPDVDKCAFTQYVTSADDYGNDKKEVAATYGFTRAIEKRINWDKFPNQNLIKVAPGFKFGPDYMMKVAAERRE